MSDRKGRGRGRGVSVVKAGKGVTVVKAGKEEISIIYTGGYHIPKSNLSKDQIDHLEKDLTIVPSVMDFGNKTTETYSFPMYKDDGEKYCVPMHWGITNYGMSGLDIDKIWEMLPFTFKGELRGTQAEIVKHVLEILAVKMCGIMQLHTGYGKTILAIYIASVLRLKTLVIVHKTDLLDQWIERISKFTDAVIGVIHQKKVDIVGKNIVIGMLQSLSMINYPPSTFDDFGLVIIDECFPGYTKIATCDGDYTIRELYLLTMNGYNSPLVLSYNERERVFEYKRVTFAWKKVTKMMVHVSVSGGDGVVKCTPNHRFLIDNGEYKCACDLLVGDILKSVEGVCVVNKVEHVSCHSAITVYDIEVEDNHNFVLSGVGGRGIVVHNCHHSSSRVFSQAFFKIRPKYLLSLSATVKRNDGTLYALHSLLGEVMVKVARKTNNIVHAVKFDYSCKDKNYVEKYRRYGGKRTVDVVKTTTDVSEIECRNTFIRDIICNLVRYKSRKILVLSKRIQQLVVLKEMVDKVIAEMGWEYVTGMYTGKQSKKVRAESTYADIIFATYGIAEEGLDIFGLNTLVLASSIKDPVQAIGRIMRGILEEGDIHPLLIDFNDNMDLFSGWCADRMVYYKNEKYNVVSVRVRDNVIVPVRQILIEDKVIEDGAIISIDEMREVYLKHVGSTLDFRIEKKNNFRAAPEKMFDDHLTLNILFDLPRASPLPGDQDSKIDLFN